MRELGQNLGWAGAHAFKRLTWSATKAAMPQDADEVAPAFGHPGGELGLSLLPAMREIGQ